MVLVLLIAAFVLSCAWCLFVLIQQQMSRWLRVLGWVLAGTTVVFVAAVVPSTRGLLPGALAHVAGPFMYLLLMASAIVVIALITLDG